MPRSLSCRDCLRLLRESRVGDMTPSGAAPPHGAAPPELAAHLAQCPDCAREQRLYVGVSADLRAVTLPAVPPDLRDRVRRTLQAENAAQAERKRSAWYLAPWLLSGGAATVTAMLIVMVYLRAPHSTEDIAASFGSQTAAPASSGGGAASANKSVKDLANADAHSKSLQLARKGQESSAAVGRTHDGATGSQDRAAPSQDSPAVEGKPGSSLRFGSPSSTSPSTAPALGVPHAELPQKEIANSQPGAAMPQPDKRQTAPRGNSQNQSALSQADRENSERRQNGGRFSTSTKPPVKAEGSLSASARPESQGSPATATKPVFLATLRIVSPPKAVSSELSRTKLSGATQNDRMRAAPSPVSPGSVGQQQSAGDTSAQRGGVQAPAPPSAPATNTDAVTSNGFGMSPQNSARIGGSGGRGGFGGRGSGGGRGGGNAPDEAQPPQGATNPAQDAAPTMRKAVPPHEGGDVAAPADTNNGVVQGRVAEARGNSSLNSSQRAGNSTLSAGGAANKSGELSSVKGHIAPKPHTPLSQAKQSRNALANMPFYALNVSVVQAVLQVNPTRDVKAAHLDLILPVGVELLAPLRGQAGATLTVWRGATQRGQLITVPLRLRLSGRGDQNFYKTPNGLGPRSREIKLTLRGMAANPAKPGMEQVTIVASQSLRIAS